MGCTRVALLALREVTVAPWGQPLLRDISFELAAGEILGILGPNGAGKTTLLNLVCGALAPADGGIYLGGRPMTDWPIVERARAQAVLPQQSSLNFPYTVEEVILLGRTPHASGAACDREILDATLAATDMLALRERLYTQLSGGEKQRVQLARAFAQIWRSRDCNTRVLLLDEPTSALDLSHQKMVMESIRRLASEGCAVVMVLHDFNLAARYADRCLVLGNGRQQALGTPGEIFNPALFREVFEVEVRVEKHPALDIPLVIET